MKLDPEQKDLIRACEEGGFFVDAEKRVVIIRISYKQHRYNADNVRQDRALSVERQELIHPLTGRVMPDVNVVKDTSTMILRLNDIVRGEYVGRAAKSFTTIPPRYWTPTSKIPKTKRRSRSCTISSRK